MYGNPYPGAYPGVYNPGPNVINPPAGQPQAQTLVNNQNAGYVCRPVTSREEAVASQVDFLGPGTIMPDFGHGMIYFKRFNPNSGGAEFFDFSVQPPPQAQQTAPNNALLQSTENHLGLYSMRESRKPEALFLIWASRSLPHSRQKAGVFFG